MTDSQAEVYIDAKQAAQICNNVSVRTFYRYLDKVSDELTVQTATEVVNDHAVKLYRKADIVRLAVALNKDRTILSYVTQNVRPSVVLNGNHNGAVDVSADKTLDRPSIIVNYWQRPPTAKMYFGTHLIGVLIITFGLTITGILIDKAFHRESRQIASLKSFIAHKKI